MNRLIFPEIFNGHVKAFFTRKSLGADRESICEVLSLESESVYLPIQKHTDTIFVLASDPEPKIADAVITQKKGVLIGVQVADCVPVLLFDKRNYVAGAVHAGWRGTASGIIKKTLLLMAERFGSSPEDIIMAVGPSIRWTCYEVGDEVKDAVFKATGDGDYYLYNEDGKCCVDLPSANIRQAVTTGVPEKNIWSSKDCTCCNHDDFHSYRYHGNYAGRQGGFIGIF